jgi:hypothetical protein
MLGIPKKILKSCIFKSNYISVFLKMQINTVRGTRLVKIQGKDCIIIS